MARSKIGFLTSGGGGNPTGIGGYVTSLHSAGIPAVVMCNDGDVGIGDALATGGNHVLLFRVVRDGSEQFSVPDYSKTPAAAAVSHWTKIRPFFHPAVITNKGKVWIQPINEVDKNRADWLGFFGVELAKIANSEGYKVALFAFSSGEPEPGHWLTPGMIAYLQYCAAHREMAAVALHEYDYGFAGMESVYPWHIGRFEFLFNTCDSLGIARPYVLITEFGWKYDDVPSQQQVLKDVDYAARLYAKYPQVLGAAIWYLGPGFNGIANKVQPLILPITNHTLTTVYPDPIPIPPPGGEPVPDNVLINGDMEGGYTVYKDAAGVTYDNIRYPAGWHFDFARPNNPPNPIAPNDPNAVFRQPEAHVLHRANVPDHEEGDFFADGDYTWKIFGQNRSIHFPLWQDGIPPGEYDLSYHIFPDMYEWEGHKVFGTDPDCCILWVETDVMTTPLQRPPIGQASRPVFRVTVGNGGWIKLWYLFTWAFDNNGAWIDGIKAVPVNVTPPPTIPPPTGATFPERLWNASITEQNTNGIVFHPDLGLWKEILDDGLAAVTHERAFEGVVYQAAEKPDRSERWVYTWTPTAGITRFKWPPLVPPVPPPTPFEFEVYPVQGQTLFITSSFNAPRDYGIHEGIDLKAATGAPIVAVADGVVEYVRAEDISGYGLYVRVNHDGRYKTWYAHMLSVNVALGQFVQAGHVLGLADNTGNSTGSHLHLTLQDLEEGLDGYVVAKVVDPAPFLAKFGGGTVEMTPYFLPAVGDYGDICILKNNWGQGDERQQLQKSGAYSFVTKNQKWERRRIASDGIYLELDTSPNESEYYTVTGSAWLPLRWNPGQEHTRTETVKFFSKANCTATQAPYTVTNKIKFAALHSAWTSPAGVQLANVIELQWLIAGVVEESYWFAPGKGLVQWKNKAGKHSWVTSIVPVGQQGNNVREVGCFG